MRFGREARTTDDAARVERIANMSKWIEEELEPGLRVSYGLKEQLRSSTSKFQTVDVVDLEPFGRTLLIDGLIQSCQIDEFVYHESLVHPALLMHPNPNPHCHLPRFAPIPA